MLRHVLLLSLVCNLSSSLGATLALAAIHVHHCLPLLAPHLLRQPLARAFPVPVACAFFVLSAAACRFPALLDVGWWSAAIRDFDAWAAESPAERAANPKWEARAPAAPRSRAHERLRSGSTIGRAAYATSGAFCLAALLATEGGGDAPVPPAVAVGLFALGFCNAHAALSSEASHWASAPASAVALAGNAAAWSQQLARLSVPALRVPCASAAVALDRAIAAWRLSRFGATLTMWQLAVVSLLLLRFEVRFRNYLDFAVRACGVAQGAVVILPMLSDRAGFAPGGDDPAAADRSSAADALFLALYTGAFAGFFFGGALERAYSAASAALYMGVLAGFFRVRLPGVVDLAVPIGWPLELRPTIAMWLFSLFFLRFRYLFEPRVKGH